MRIPVIAALGLVLAATPGTIAAQVVAGTVHDSLFARGPMADARVVLEGFGLDAVTDRRGRFALRDVPPGEHRLTFFHPRLDSLGLAAPVYRVTVGESGAPDLRLAVPSYASLSAYLCGAVQDSTTMIVLGRARRAEDGAPLEGAEARVEWFDLAIGGGVGLRREDRVASSRSDPAGEFTLCGVPNDIELSMRVVAGDHASGPLDFTPTASPIVVRDVHVSVTDPATAWPGVGGDSGMARRGTARLRVRVRDDRGRPVENAIIGVRGQGASGTTDADGAATLSGVPSGSQTVVVRAVGRAPATRIVALVPGGETTLGVEMQQVTALLPEMRVTGLAPDALERAIERRRRSGNGYFVDREEMDRRGGGWRVLATVPGVWLQQGPMGGYPMPMFRDGQGHCAPTIFVDGAPRNRMDGWELHSLLQIARQVEVYTRGLLLPPEFALANACGAVVIWTI